MNAVWARWKRFARRIGDFQARLLLVIFYFALLGPFAIVVRWRFDPLAMKPGTPRGWLRRPVARQPSLEQALKQS